MPDSREVFPLASNDSPEKREMQRVEAVQLLLGYSRMASDYLQAKEGVSGLRIMMAGVAALDTLGVTAEEMAEATLLTIGGSADPEEIASLKHIARTGKLHP